MKKVWIAADSIVSPLGLTTAENYENLRQGVSGLSLIQDVALNSEPFYGGKIATILNDTEISKFEALCKSVIEQLLSKASFDPKRSIFILSTTKGNITFLEEGQTDHPRIHLHKTAAYLSDLFGFKDHLAISNACISGVMAIVVGKRMIEAGQYHHAVVVGADVLSRFVISGFQSLQALSVDKCKPFDAKRNGINLGECAAGIVLSSVRPESESNAVCIAGGGLSNDANHISGPSRTGEELGFAVRQAVEESKIALEDIDFVSAHGTATVYNDEMEAKAFHLLNLNEVPLNSFKGYYGHTLGAAGILETILSAQSLKHNELIATAGFDQPGVSKSVNIIKHLEPRPLRTCLKTASGFGGCNAAIILQKQP